MATYLQLYLDTDFIIPIGVGDSGNFSKYIDRQASRRRWLYFSRSASGTLFESSEANKANFDAGKEGFYGDFWKHIDNDDKVPGESFKYIDLLDLSRIVSDLREWSDATLFTEAPEIVLNFSTVIPVKARRRIAEYLQQKIGNVRSFSIELNDLLASKIQNDYRTLAPRFGDQLLIIQSAGNDILMSVMTWCGDRFMQGDEPVRLAKKGNEFLKRALAKLVVDYYEQRRNMLLPAQMEREYAYQVQFTDQWLRNRKGDEDFWIENFHYSGNPGKTYPPMMVDGKHLNLIEKEAIRSTINDIANFYRNNIVNSHLHTILVGDIFKEEVFLKDCVAVTSSDGKYTYFNDNAIQEALGRYNVRHSTLTEELRNLERMFMDKANERSRIRTYVHNAEVLGSLRDAATTAAAALTAAVNAVALRNNDLVASWESFMRHSDFAHAAEMTERMAGSDDLLLAKNEAIECLKRIERANSMLIELEQLADVKPIVDSVRADEKQLRELIDITHELNDLPDTLRATTQKFSDCYGRYKELRRLFDREQSIVGRKKLVEEMAELTMEEMPVTDIEYVTGKVTVEVTSSGGFLGFGAKKSVGIKVSVDNPLPCRAVLIVSPKVITTVPDDRYGIFAVDIDKGESGVVYEATTDLSALGLDKNANKLFIKFWPHEDEVISPNLFSIGGTGYVTI